MGRGSLDFSHRSCPGQLGLGTVGRKGLFWASAHPSPLTGQEGCACPPQTCPGRGCVSPFRPQGRASTPQIDPCLSLSTAQTWPAVASVTPQAGLGPLLCPPNPSTGGAEFCDFFPSGAWRRLRDSAQCLLFLLIIPGAGAGGHLLEQAFLTLAAGLYKPPDSAKLCTNICAFFPARATAFHQIPKGVCDPKMSKDFCGRQISNTFTE